MNLRTYLVSSKMNLKHKHIQTVIYLLISHSPNDPSIQTVGKDNPISWVGLMVRALAFKLEVQGSNPLPIIFDTYFFLTLFHI